MIRFYPLTLSSAAQRLTEKSRVEAGTAFQSPFGSVQMAERISDMFQAEFAPNSATPIAAHLQKIALVALEAGSPRQIS
ncbi:hypothetical protein PoB_001195500 [Plakobranchus ocellatus]|uniref:Uncharacterized protein n=1 Tax=Plakobranchus ocellatus TaxID=259542 RepID=A0AAV3YSP4_9GAST|nr:hypothetical protein PoB_001195500 [Plakobranchus ocellatus]